jgi:predicted NUDIX family NTP pyrophosphohydrolase
MMFRRRKGAIEIFLVHPGGPFFARKDEGSWSIPKGEIEPGQDPLGEARREFEEETGRSVESCGFSGAFMPLGSVRQAGGKVVHAWAFEGDWPAGVAIESNRFSLEWPPRSGRIERFPEADRGEFFDPAAARTKINPAQVMLIERLLEQLGAS